MDFRANYLIEFRPRRGKTETYRVRVDSDTGVAVTADVRGPVFEFVDGSVWWATRRPGTVGPCRATRDGGFIEERRYEV